MARVTRTIAEKEPTVNFMVALQWCLVEGFIERKTKELMVRQNENRKKVEYSILLIIFLFSAGKMPTGRSIGEESLDNLSKVPYHARRTRYNLDI